MFNLVLHIYFMFFIVSLASMFVTIMVAITAKEVADNAEFEPFSKEGSRQSD